MHSEQSFALNERVGPQLEQAIPDLARLRITVFREFPYLYDGSAEYEELYLQSYLKSELSYVVLVSSGGRVVGASTGMPLAAESEDIGNPFRRHGFDVEATFYCGESVLLPEFRGWGIGRQFMQLREAHARRHGFKFMTFCAVNRPDDHPRRPADYRPLHDFWLQCGFAPVDKFQLEFDWRDIDEETSSAKPMNVWMKTLEARCTA